MKIGTATRHAMITAGCIAQHANEGSVLSTFISEEHGIPHDYLQKILQRMVKANILKSKKGPKGGFTLARPAKEITLLEIIEVSGGPIASQLNMAELTGNAHFSVEMENVCKKASEKAATILGRAKLSQMVG